MTEPMPPKQQARMRWRALWFALFSIGIGIIGAAAWAVFAHRPTYTVTENYSAFLSELGQADVFSSDALYIGLAALCGLIVGILAWIRLRDTGWLVCALSTLGGFVSGVGIWLVGLLLSPRSFDKRLAAAAAGDSVPIDLTLHSLSALLVGPFAAIVPVMLCAAFWPENESSKRRAPAARRVAALD